MHTRIVPHRGYRTGMAHGMSGACMRMRRAHAWDERHACSGSDGSRARERSYKSVSKFLSVYLSASYFLRMLLMGPRHAAASEAHPTRTRIAWESHEDRWRIA